MEAALLGARHSVYETLLWDINDVDLLPLHLGRRGRSLTRVGQCSRIDPVTLGSWSNSAPNPYQSATAVRQRSSAIAGLTHSLGVVGSIAKVPGPPLFTKSGSITY